MKKYLHEDVEENTRLLRDLTKILFAWISNQQKRGQKTQLLVDIPGYSMLSKRYVSQTIFKNHKKYLDDLEIDVFFDDFTAGTDRFYKQFKDQQGHTDLTLGYYHYPTNRLAVFYNDIITAAEGDSSARVDRLTNVTISHELRHFFQYQEYPEYYSSKTVQATEYARRATEIDAVFYEVLANTDPFVHIGKPQDYVKTVMDLLQQQRSLTAKQQQQYRKQTARYFAKHVDQNLSTVWKKALSNNARYLDLRHPKETFVGNVMDELESYVANAHFRDMHDPVYLEYRRLTRQYYDAKTWESREQQKASKIYAIVHPIMIAQIKNTIPLVSNSSITQTQAMRIIMNNTRQVVQSKGINTETSIYDNLESKIKQRVSEILKRY